MTLSRPEVDAIVRAALEGEAPSVRARSKIEFVRLLDALPDFKFQTKRATPLAMLCTAGVDYGWRELEKAARRDLLADLSNKAKVSLRQNLRHRLERITRPCFELEWKSFGLAMSSIGVPGASPDSKLAERMFLRDKPSDRLFSLFRKFPVLASLWSQVILQWRHYVMEVLSRFTLDRGALSRAFFSGKPIARIVDLRCDLSDWHNSGRTVARIRCEAGSIIYKPRSGLGEWEWFALLKSMNARSFRPRLRVAEVLRRPDHCWMEYVDALPCRDEAAVRRFYERIGGMIAAAYLLRAVDCHRDNAIACGEDPVLVDADALWHVSALTAAQPPLDLLYRTGFFPNSRRASLQSRSSILGRTTNGKHLPRIDGRPVSPGPYAREIVSGFTRGWRSILGTKERRSAFLGQLRRIRVRERRWIYWATEKYGAIRQGSIQPAVLRSGKERDRLITGSCTRPTVSSAVVRAEIEALKRLDIPYFLRTTKESMNPDAPLASAEVLKALQRALLLT
jgi:lantibiotic modifying enzyme